MTNPMSLPFKHKSQPLATNCDQFAGFSASFEGQVGIIAESLGIWDDYSRHSMGSCLYRDRETHLVNCFNYFARFICLLWTLDKFSHDSHLWVCVAMMPMENAGGSKHYADPKCLIKTISRTSAVEFV